MKNILEQARAKGELIRSGVDENLLIDPSEKLLAATAGVVATDVGALQAKRDYASALSRIATLRPVVDAFFEGVMVMVPEADVRANRLALLDQTLGDFSRIADFSEIVTAK
jgi:glycyl-tRNA synthetase beta chain